MKTQSAMVRWSVLAVTLAALATGTVVTQSSAQDVGQGATGVGPESGTTAGALEAIGKDGSPVGLCPLKHTDVNASISGFIARTEVTQQFHNPFDTKIEAVYTFPLPEDAAVDDMLMRVGDRQIRADIKEREEARQVYEQAKAAGHVASLLDQERPNIFTQSVANIMPGEEVDVTIRYVELLPYEDGWFEFTFPTVVGPRYIPGSPTSRVPDVPKEIAGQVVQVPGPDQGPAPTGTGWAPDTNQVPDASRITPPVIAKGMRVGHDISIHVSIDAGAKIQRVRSVLHEVRTQQQGERADVTLVDKAAIPNKDFILRYSTATDEIGDAVLTHASEKGRFFSLVLQPPKRVKAEQVTPKELVFVLDSSGSMSGDPVEKAKETMLFCLDNLNERDTFNLITFAGSTDIVFTAPRPATPQNIGRAQEYLAGRHGSGGTEMMKAIVAALEPSDAQDHIRIVVFMTDGYVGNDMAIIDEIQRHPNARVFSFGVGQAPNRFLLDNMASAGRGEVDYVPLSADGRAVAERFYERMRNPVLTDIELDFGSLPVTELYPPRIPDLFSAKPVVVTGMATGSGQGKVVLRGKIVGQPFEREIALTLPKTRAANEVLSSLWARRKVDYLMSQDWLGAQLGQPRTDTHEQVVALGLKYRLMTQYTSFVAVEELVVTEGGKARTIPVPVEMPEGVSYEGVFGEPSPAPTRPAAPTAAAGVQVDASVKRVFGPAGAMGDKGATGERGAAGPGGPKGEKGDAGPVGAIALEEKPDTVGGQEPEDGLTPAERKLAPELRGLAERVKKEGRDGDLKKDAFEVKGGVVEVAIYLSDDSDEVIAKLKELGVEVLAHAKTVRMVLAKVNVKDLEAIAALDSVTRVALPPR